MHRRQRSPFKPQAVNIPSRASCRGCSTHRSEGQRPRLGRKARAPGGFSRCSRRFFVEFVELASQTATDLLEGRRRADRRSSSARSCRPSRPRPSRPRWSAEVLGHVLLRGLRSLGEIPDGGGALPQDVEDLDDFHQRGPSPTQLGHLAKCVLPYAGRSPGTSPSGSYGTRRGAAPQGPPDAPGGGYP